MVCLFTYEISDFIFVKKWCSIIPRQTCIRIGNISLKFIDNLMVNCVAYHALLLSLSSQWSSSTSSLAVTTMMMLMRSSFYQLSRAIKNCGALARSFARLLRFTQFLIFAFLMKFAKKIVRVFAHSQCVLSSASIFFLRFFPFYIVVVIAPSRYCCNCCWYILCCL